VEFYCTGILIAILFNFFQIHVCECFDSSSCNFKINRNKNIVTYLHELNYKIPSNTAKIVLQVVLLHGFDFSILTLDEKTEIKNSGSATPD
jgi:hypothetical protein